MTRLLIVANQTATSEPLVARVREMVREHPGAELVLLVPATAVRHLLRRSEETEATAAAKRRADEAADLFGREGLPLAAIKVGAESPVEAVADELAQGGYDAVVVSTLPRLSSRWAELDLPERIRAAHGLPVHHVEVPPAWLAAWDVG